MILPARARLVQLYRLTDKGRNSTPSGGFTPPQALF